MQYLLTEEEMQIIQNEREVLRKLGGVTLLTEGLKNVCTYVACQMSETGSRLANGRKPSEAPHGCIHIPDSTYAMVKEDHRNDDPPVKRFYTPTYCSDCPVVGICPMPKNWSK